MISLLGILSYAYAVSLSPSPSSNGTAVVPDFASFSIEFWCFSDYAGNASQPNTFFQQLLQNLQSLTGKSPAIRIGGTSCDTTYYNSSLPKPSQIPSNSYGTFQPDNVSYGPMYFESFSNFANDTEFTFGINLALNTSQGLPNAKNEAQAAIQGIGGNLKVLEWGNEPDLYAPSLRPADYNQSSYVMQWLAASSTINSSLDYQFGSAARMPDEVGGFQFETLLDDGINATGHANVFSQHIYFFSQTTPGLSLAHLMNHTNTISTLEEFVLTAKDAQAQGVMYILGETSSVSTGGTHGISDVYGASLWVLDYLCYSASHGIKKMYFHQHTNHTDVTYAYPYTALQPVAIDSYGPSPRPLYYGIAAFDSAIGTGKSVVDISDTIPAYALYSNGTLDTLVVVNMAMHNQSSTSRGNMSVEFTLPGKVTSARQQILSGIGADVQTNITFDGAIFQNTTGMRQQISAQGTNQTITNGSISVTVQDSEAVIVHLY